MDTIFAAETGFYEGLASELPDVEPDVADLAAIEGGLFDLVQDHLMDLDVQLAELGHVDELEVRRFRRAVRASLRPVEEIGGVAA